MFKNKTEQNRNDDKYNQTGLTVEIHTNHDGVRAIAIMLRSIAASLSWRSPVIEVKQASHRPPFQWKNKSFLWYSFQCLERKATSVTAAEFYGAVIPSHLHVPVNSAVVHSWYPRLEQFVKKLAWFYEPQFGWILLNISLSDTVLETKNLRAKVLNSTCRTTQVCKLSQNVNFDDLEFNGFGTLMVWHFWQL